MKRSIIILLLVALMAGLATFWTARSLICQDNGRPEDLIHNREFLTNALQLREDQQQTLANMEKELGLRMNAGCARHCAARQRLAAALTGTTPDQKILNAVIMDMCRTYEASERTALDHILALRAMLDDEQRKTFDTMLGRCLCGTCGKDCHSPKSP